MFIELAYARVIVSNDDKTVIHVLRIMSLACSRDACGPHVLAPEGIASTHVHSVVSPSRLVAAIFSLPVAQLECAPSVSFLPPSLLHLLIHILNGRRLSEREAMTKHTGLLFADLMSLMTHLRHAAKELCG